jgi:tetratricopeptide (TPR) repeat protein
VVLSLTRTIWTREAESNLEKAECAHEKKNFVEAAGYYDKAIRAYEQAIRLTLTADKSLSNKLINALSYQARNFIDYQKYDEANCCIDKGIKEAEKDDKADHDLLAYLYFLKGRVLFDKNKREKIENKNEKDIESSILWYNKAIKIDNGNPDYWFYKALSFEFLKRYQEAIMCYDESLKLDPNSKEVWHNKGLALYSLGDTLNNTKTHYEMALACFNKAIALNYYYSIAWLNKGNALFRLGRYKEANECYDEAINQYEKSSDKKQGSESRLADAWYNKGMALHKLVKYDRSKYQDSIDSYNKAIALNDDNYDSLNKKALLLSNIGNEHRQALRYNEDSLKKNALLKNSYTLDNVDELLGNCNVDIDIDKLISRGVIFYNSRKYQDALAWFNKALDKAGEGNISSKKYALYYNGNIKYYSKEYDNALEYYDKALDIDPQFAEAHNAKAIALSAKGEYSDAIKEAEKAVACDPSLSSSHRTLVEVAHAIKGIERQSFWDFWNASAFRRIVAITLGVAAVSLIIYPALLSALGSDLGDQPQNADDLASPRTIPEIYLAGSGLLILILLSPYLTKVKVGPIEFELDRPDPSEKAG